LAALVNANHGEEKATEWAQGVGEQHARATKGVTPTRLRGLVSAKCRNLCPRTPITFAPRDPVPTWTGSALILSKIDRGFPYQKANGAHMNLIRCRCCSQCANRATRSNPSSTCPHASASLLLCGQRRSPPFQGGILAEFGCRSFGEFTADEVNLSEVAKNIPAATEIF